MTHRPAVCVAAVTARAAHRAAATAAHWPLTLCTCTSADRLPACAASHRVLVVDDVSPLAIEWAPAWGSTASTHPAPLTVDVAALTRRGASMSRAGDALLSAVLGAARGRHARRLHVLDATAGLGRDAFALAVGGAGAVTLVERSPALACLLDDALAHARREGGAAAVAAARMTLVHADAMDALDRGSGLGVDVVYIDPMFESVVEARAAARGEPEEAGTPPFDPAPTARPGSTAAPRRESQFLAALAGPARDAESAALLRRAIAVATARVVVKRHARAPPVGATTTPPQRRSLGDSGVQQPTSPSPSRSVGGRSVRYDVYDAAPATPP